AAGSHPAVRPRGGGCLRAGLGGRDGGHRGRQHPASDHERDGVAGNRLATEPQDGPGDLDHRRDRHLWRRDVRHRERGEQRVRERERRRQYGHRLADHGSEHGERPGGALGRRRRPRLHDHRALQRPERQRVDRHHDRHRHALSRAPVGARLTCTVPESRVPASMPAFSSFDTRGYRTVSAREGYGLWSPSYEETVKEDMALWLLDQVRTVDWGATCRAADLGCGTGRTGSWLAAHGVRRIDGIDLTPEMPERARRRGVFETLAVADVCASGLEAHAYDLVTTSLVDEHLPDLAPP